MKKRFVILLIFFFIATSGPYAQAQQKDVKGWRDARWGLNEDQLLALFKGEAIRLNEVVEYKEWYAAIAIPNYEISDYEYTVHFLMDKKNKTLEQVNIIATSKTLESIYKAFSQLEKVLREKYGPPSFRNDGETDTRDVIWNFPSIIIDLSLMDMKIIHFKNLVIKYTQPTKDKNKI